MSWFCHGLEEHLRNAGAARETAIAALGEVGRFRGVLGGLLDDPASALVSLRALTRKTAGAYTSVRPREDEPAPRSIPPDEGTIRVATTSVDSLLDRIVEMAQVREQLSARAEADRDCSKQLRRLRAELAEALRLIGPPRPWGAPAAALRKIERAAGMLGAIGDQLEQSSHTLRASDAALRDGTLGAKRALAAMRQVPVRTLFARVAQAVDAEARRLDRPIVVRTRGGDETIDRRLAELLAEPCLHIARNAIAHGIEPPDERVRNGKAATATVTLWARKSAGRLLIGLEDDGRGVDVAFVRKRAVEAGAVTEAVASAADEDTLLGLLFLPGFSTHEGADLLAGRGIGLDLALAAVQRLGGAIRLSSRRGHGFEARLDVPVESGLVTVLWVEAGGMELALAAAHARAVRKSLGGSPCPPLAACLDAFGAEPAQRRPGASVASSGPIGAAPYAVDLEVGESEGPIVSVGVDRVGRMEEVLVRPLSPIVTSVGPFAGAIVRGDGSLRLALDAYALAPRARALAVEPHAR
jgi:two-component system chemotaxis sensor kinase CheA